MTAALAPAPADVRPAVAKLWGPHQHLFPSPLPIAAAVALWVGEHGLTEDDARAVLRDMTGPAAMAGYKFASDLMTDLAVRAEAAITAARRAEYDRERAAADRRLWRERDRPGLAGDVVHSLLSARGLLGSTQETPGTAAGTHTGGR